MAQIGNQILKHTDSILSALYSEGADQAIIDEVMRRLAPRAERDAGWDSEPPLLSDETYALGAGSQIQTVYLPILGGDYYCSYLLPRVEEWSVGLFGGDALSRLQQAAVDPLGYLLELFHALVRLPGGSALKVSFYEACAYTLSSEHVTVDPKFFAKCPPNQQIGVLRQVVAINHANFTDFVADLPLPVRQQISLFRLLSIQSMQILSEQLTGLIQQQTARLMSGGLESIGTADGGSLPEEKPATSTPSKRKRLVKSGS